MQPVRGHPSLKERQRRERENLILQAAEEVLTEKGYYETSIDEIAARVGIAKGTVYLHFPSKEDLVLAIFQRDMQQILQSIDAMISSDLTARSRLETVQQFMFEGMFRKHFQLLYTILNNPGTRKLFVEKECSMRDLWAQLADRVTTLIEEGKASGEFDASIPTPVMVSAFFNLLSPRAYERLWTEEKMLPEEVVKQLGRIYFSGIAKQ
jgi:TetR/AcrR family transcriptional regulator, fatty acid metabolism regulator protein